MDMVKAFFNSSIPVIKLRAPMTSGHRITSGDPTLLLNRREEHRHSLIVSGTDYARSIKEREAEIYKKNAIDRANYESVAGGLDSMEHLSLWSTSEQNIGELTEEAMTEVYNKYSFQRKEDCIKLAIHDYKEEILEQIEGYPVTIIEGATGCGKTTQVPQWILDDAYQKRKPCKIIVTQPRRIAAISIAKRVAHERGWDVGGLVGYQVALDNKTTTDTRITYVTTGVLLQKLVRTKNLNEYTHIILDEVHERNQEMDFLLLIVKKFLFTVSPKVKVILMSATFNIGAFCDYFAIPTSISSQSPACIQVVKEPMFTVKVFYLNHLNKFGWVSPKSAPKSAEPGISQEMYHLVIKLVNAFERIDKLEDDYSDRSDADIPSVLMFLPGINEIEELYACLTDVQLRKKLVNTECGSYKWWVLPLHSTITADEQVRVFQRAPLGHRKIILATNIAESSITVPDIKYVVDFCLMKILVADETTNFTSLQLSWASKTNCEQRAGRAGRVRDGRVYRLVPDKFYDELPQESPPEIIRCSLERLVLLAKMLEMGPPCDILALAMDPPDMSNIHRTILVLKEVGALMTTLNNEWCMFDGDVTYMGRVMARLPLDVRVSKVIVLGYIYGCLEDSIVMAAAMSVKNIFSSPFKERLNAFNSKLTWADGSTSDSIAFLNVYKVWSHLRQQQVFKENNSEAQWARRFFVQLRALRELSDLVRDIRARLALEGIDPLHARSPWSTQDLPLILKVILAGAFYPQYFVQVSRNAEREREAVRALCGLDPRNTVYLRNFPPAQPHQIYAAAIKNVVRQHIGDEPRVTFDKIGQKVFLSFVEDDFPRSCNKSGDPTIPGQVVLPVYKAIKARQLKMEIRIPLLPVDKALAMAKALEESRVTVDVNMMVPRLPDIDQTLIPIKICHLINVGNFWAQNDDESTANELNQIQKALNYKPLLAITDTIEVDMLIAAPYVDNNSRQYYRARVTRVLPRDVIEVSYVDYGTAARVGAGEARELPAGARTTSPLAMRCVLHAVAPAPLLHAHAHGHAHWSPDAHRLLATYLAKPHLIAKVYSVTHGVVSLELLLENGNINVNNELIKRGFAVPCEESYDSKLNHDLRQTAYKLNMAQQRAYNKEQKELAFNQVQDVKSPSYKDCISDVCLIGPASPLETVLHNLMYASREKQVSIEWNSVNSVLLDTAPQEIYQRLLVAGTVGQNETSSKLTLRHTTMMPNIPCLPAIIALIFCPVAELRRHTDGSRYVSALCGLGADEAARPRFPEHDLLVDVDADLSVDDFGIINHIRYLMDYMLYCGPGQDAPSIDDEFRANVPQLLRKNILELFRKRRKHREPESVPNAWEWKSVPEHELLEISVPDMAECVVVYPLHTPLELHPLPRDQLRAMKREHEELERLVNSTTLSSRAQLTCTLCGTPPMPTHAMRLHLYSNTHKEKTEDFRTLQS